MTGSSATSGYFRSGLPYNRIGTGPHPLVVFQGLVFENKPLPNRLAARLSGYQSLGKHYTTYIVTRKPGLPDGYSLKDMSDDYAIMIQEEFGGPVDVIGVSTGGSIAQHFSADHPDLVRRLVLHSAAHTLSGAGKEVQMRTANLARQRKWQKANAAMLGFIMPPGAGIKGYGSRIAVWLGSFVMARIGPKDPSDLIITVLAEDRHTFQDRLSEITSPTLVVAGDKDPFYSETLFRETAEGITNARLILYPGMGHPASGKQFCQDVLAFLKENSTHPEEGA